MNIALILIFFLLSAEGFIHLERKGADVATPHLSMSVCDKNLKRTSENCSMRLHSELRSWSRVSSVAKNVVSEKLREKNSLFPRQEVSLIIYKKFCGAEVMWLKMSHMLFHHFFPHHTTSPDNISLHTDKVWNDAKVVKAVLGKNELDAIS